MGIWLDTVGKQAAVEMSAATMLTLAGVSCKACCCVVDVFSSSFSADVLQFRQRVVMSSSSSEHCVANLRLQVEQVMIVTPRFLQVNQTEIT